MTASRILSIRQWPAPVLNGVSVGLGLALVTALIGLLAGMPAAITAASGASSTSVADTVCAPQAKRWQILPAVIGTMLVTALVICTHASPLWLTATILLITFASIFWMAWGKRGGPQTFVMVLCLVFQMAAFHGKPTMDWAQAWQHLAWVSLGALSMAAWSALSIRVLARRYRTLALADSLEALAATMRAQAHWTAQHKPPQPTPKPEALLALIGQQAGIADVFQSARDLLYSQAGAPRATPFTQRQIHTLIHIVNLRDVVQASQLDFDKLPRHEATSRVIHIVSEQLLVLARRLQDSAYTWRTGRRLPAPDLPAPTWPDAEHPVLASLGRRCAHMRSLVDLITQSIKPPPSSPAQHAAPAVSEDQAAVLRTLVSPVNWALAPLKAQLDTRSPVLRYALRATLAVGCADGLAHVLPWASHPHWLLMTVAVVMRGNLEQTLARRDARVQGTLVGCLIASALLSAGGPSSEHSAWLFLALVASLSLAHGFVLINYRVTAAAGAVLALVQGHLFNPSHHPALVDAAERLGDTLIGAALAWVFSYVLPSWERQQLPRLVQRLMQAQSHYTHHALRWHLDHARTPRRSLARREVYDLLWLLSQSLQRMAKEPRANQAWAPALEAVLLHSNRLISHLASIKGLLTVRQQDFDAQVVGPALLRSEQGIGHWLAHSATSAEEPPSSTQAADADADADDESGEIAAEAAGKTPPQGPLLHDWLMTRLHQAEEEARLLAQAAWRLDACQARGSPGGAAPQRRNTL